MNFTFETYIPPAGGEKHEMLRAFLDSGLGVAIPMVDGKVIPAHKAQSFRRYAKDNNIPVWAKGETKNSTDRIVFILNRADSYPRN